MSKEALAKVVQRAISDGAFRRQLSTDPGTALRGFDLTADESAAIRSGDSSRLSTLGVDLRMSKAFSLATDAATGNSARQVLSNDLGASYTGANLAAQSAAGTSANTLGGDQGAAGSNALTSGDQGDNEPILTGGDTFGRDAAVIPGGPAHALGSLTSGENSGTFGNVLTAGDLTAEGAIVVDDAGASGASTPGEASGGPTIQQ